MKKYEKDTWGYVTNGKFETGKEVLDAIPSMTEDEAKDFLELAYPEEMNLVENSIKRGGTYKGNLEFMVLYA